MWFGNKVYIALLGVIKKFFTELFNLYVYGASLKNNLIAKKLYALVLYTLKKAKNIYILYITELKRKYNFRLTSVVETSRKYFPLDYDMSGYKLVTAILHAQSIRV